MKEYIMRVDPTKIKKLKEFGEIIFESSILTGLIGFKTMLPAEKLEELDFVYKVEDNSFGEFLTD